MPTLCFGAPEWRLARTETHGNDELTHSNLIRRRILPSHSYFNRLAVRQEREAAIARMTGTLIGADKNNYLIALSFFLSLAHD